MWGDSVLGRLSRHMIPSEGLSPRHALDGSLLWRGLSRVGGEISRLGSGSRLLSVNHVGSWGAAGTGSGAETEGGSLIASLAGEAGGKIARVIGGGAVGMYARRGARGLRESGLTGGGWVRVVGTFAAVAGLVQGVDYLRVLPNPARSAGTASTAGTIGTIHTTGVVAVVLLTLGVFMLAAGGRLVHRSMGAGEMESAEPAPSASKSTHIVLAFVAAVLGVASGLGPPLAVGVTAGLMVVLAGSLFLIYRPEGLLLLLAAFPWLDYVARRTLGALGSVWDEVLLLGSLCALAWAVVVVRRVRLPRIPLLVPLAVAGVVAVGSLAVREVPGGVAVFALRVTFQPLIFFFLGYLLPKDRRWVKATVIVFLLTTFLMASHGLFQYVTGASMPESWVDARETAIGTRAYSIVENPNGLGAFLLPGALLAASLALSRIPRGHRLLAALVAMVVFAGVAVTFSRGAWLGLIAGAGAFLVLAHRRLIPGLLGAGLISVLVLPQAFLNRLIFAFSPEYINKSLAAGRLYIWDVALRRAVEHPWFGVGLGTFGGTSAYIFEYSRLWVDSFYLQLAMEGGFVLLAAFLWLLFRAGKGVVASYLRTTDPFLKAVAAGIFGGFVAVVVANLTASVWETLVVGAAFWFLTGVAWSLPNAAGVHLPQAGDLGDEPEIPV